MGVNEVGFSTLWHGVSHKLDDDIRCKMKKRDLSKAFEDRRDFTPSPIVVFQRVTTPGSIYYYQDETLQLQLKVKVEKTYFRMQYGSANIFGESKYCV